MCRCAVCVGAQCAIHKEERVCSMPESSLKSSKQAGVDSLQDSDSAALELLDD